MPKPHFEKRVGGGALIGGSTAAAGGGLLVAHIIGFPEWEVAEGVGVAGLGLFAVFENSEAMTAINFAALHFGMYGAVAGGAVGAMSTDLPTSCDLLEVQQYLDTHP